MDRDRKACARAANGAGADPGGTGGQLHITWDHYSRVEQGRKRCSLELICALKVLLHTSTDYLLFGEGAAIPLTPEAYDLIAGELKKRLFQQS